MPQPRIYKDDAQRQAAYRQRKGRQRATHAELATLARSLHAVIQTAIVHDEFPLPHELAAARPEQTMRNLMQFFDPIYDPVRNPNGKLRRPLDLIEKEEPKTDKTPR
jgi:hypothetical protein